MQPLIALTSNPCFLPQEVQSSKAVLCQPEPSSVADTEEKGEESAPSLADVDPDDGFLPLVLANIALSRNIRTSHAFPRARTESVAFVVVELQTIKYAG